MKVYIVVVLMMLVTKDHVFGQPLPLPPNAQSQICKNQYGTECPTDVCPLDCPLLNVVSNTVSKTDFLSKIVDIDWVVLFIIEIGLAVGRSGNRVHGKWTLPAANPSGNVTTRESAFQIGQGNCTNRFDNLEIKQTADCGVALTGDNNGLNSTESFFSQDLDKYCVVYRCQDVDDTKPYKCGNGRYFVQIPESRSVSPSQPDITKIDLDLTGVPMGLIWTDIKKAKNIYFAANSVLKYVWLGKECLLNAP